MKHLRVIAPLMMFVIVAVVYYGVQAAGERKATLSAVKGTVGVKRAGADKWEAATERMVIKSGDAIRTESASSVIIRFDDNTMVKLGPMASMVLERLEKSEKGASTGLDVSVGKTWARVKKLTDESDFKVRTPTAIAGVRGTYFSSEVAEDTTSNFDVFEGSVEVASVSDPTKKVTVNEHHTTTVGAGKSPTEPTAIPSEDESKRKEGFSNEEFARAVFDVQVSITPQVVTPGEKATVSVQVFKDDAPYRAKVDLTLQLSGSAKFVANNSSEIKTATDENGAVTLEITDEVEESVSVTATLKVKVGKK
ncbi:MAG: FecR family protein [bacterium]